jgi:nucleotide-binding universal stress UspA family protein
MFDNILVAVDGSDSSLHALRQTFPIARAEKSIVKVIAVVPPYEGDLRLVGVRGHVTDMLREPYEKALAQATDMAELVGFPIKTVLEVGEPHERIADIAGANGVDLIVAGVRGHNPTDRIFMGSMVSRVIGYSRTHVMVCPRDKEVALDRILIAMDGSESAMTALHLGFDFYWEYGSELSILAVADVPSHLYGVSPAAAGALIQAARAHLAVAEREARSRAIPAHFLLREGDPVEIIVHEAGTVRTGLIIMGSHGRTGLKRLLMGSVTERVIGDAQCPVLVARAPRDCAAQAPSFANDHSRAFLEETVG